MSATAQALSARDLNRATLARQLLLEPATLGVVDAVRQLVAIQAQSPPSPYLALQARLADFDPADLDAAIADARLVKATLMRITLHLVSMDDHWDLFAALQPTLCGARLGDRRFTGAGWTVEEAERVAADLIGRLAHPHQNADVEAMLGEVVGDVSRDPKELRWLWWALRHCGPVRHHPVGGPWSFADRPSYVAARHPGSWPVPKPIVDQALEQLIERYLAGFGPATVADIAQFAMVQRGRIRPAITSMDGRLVRYDGPTGELFDLPDATLPDADVAAPPRLLPMWDSTLLAYHDRSRVLPERWRRVVIRNNGDTLPTVLVDGQVAGVWRSVPDAGGVGIEITAFEPLTEPTWEALQAQASGVSSLLADRDPEPYRRFGRWWQVVPEELTALGAEPQARVLGAS